MPIDSSNTDISRTREYCLRGTGFSQYDSFVVRKGQARRIAGLANIFQTEFLDRCLISVLLFVISCV